MKTKTPVIFNIALAGDHALNLHALAILVSQQDGFRVVSISKDAGQLGISVSESGAERYPHIVLLDVNFDLHRAAAIISFVKAAHPPIRIAALGLTKDRGAILRLFNLGVDCYIPKNSDVEQLENVLRTLACNDEHTSSMKAQAFDQSVCSAVDGSHSGVASSWPCVTASERWFFRLAISEASDDEIRRRMNLCRSTFTRLVAKVYRLFGVRSRDGLVVALYRNRFLIRDDI